MVGTTVSIDMVMMGVIVKLDSIDSVTIMGFVLTSSVVLVTGNVTMLVSTVVLVSVIGNVKVDDLDVTTVDVTGQVVVLDDTKVSASVGPLISQGSLGKGSRYVCCKGCGLCGFSLGHWDRRDARYHSRLRFSDGDSLCC